MPSNTFLAIHLSSSFFPRREKEYVIACKAFYNDRLIYLRNCLNKSSLTIEEIEKIYDEIHCRIRQQLVTVAIVKTSAERQKIIVLKNYLSELLKQDSLQASNCILKNLEILYLGMEIRLDLISTRDIIDLLTRYVALPNLCTDSIVALLPWLNQDKMLLDSTIESYTFASEISYWDRSYLLYIRTKFNPSYCFELLEWINQENKPTPDQYFILDSLIKNTDYLHQIPNTILTKIIDTLLNEPIYLYPYFILRQLTSNKTAFFTETQVDILIEKLVKNEKYAYRLLVRLHHHNPESLTENHVQILQGLLTNKNKYVQRNALHLLKEISKNRLEIKNWLDNYWQSILNQLSQELDDIIAERFAPNSLTVLDKIFEKELTIYPLSALHIIIPLDILKAKIADIAPLLSNSKKEIRNTAANILHLLTTCYPALQSAIPWANLLALIESSQEEQSKAAELSANMLVRTYPILNKENGAAYVQALFDRLMLQTGEIASREQVLFLFLINDAARKYPEEFKEEQVQKILPLLSNRNESIETELYFRLDLDDSSDEEMIENVHDGAQKIIKTLRLMENTSQEVRRILPHTRAEADPDTYINCAVEYIMTYGVSIKKNKNLALFFKIHHQLINNYLSPDIITQCISSLPSLKALRLVSYFIYNNLHIKLFTDSVLEKIASSLHDQNLKSAHPDVLTAFIKLIEYQSELLENKVIYDAMAAAIPGNIPLLNFDIIALILKPGHPLVKELPKAAVFKHLSSEIKNVANDATEEKCDVISTALRNRLSLLSNQYCTSY